MKYDFDQEIDRRGTHSVKWEFVQSESDPSAVEHTDQFFGEDRLLPLWVSDMDFACPQPVVDALVARAQHGMFGYTRPTEPYFRAVIDWMARRHGWSIRPEWIVTTPGVVTALNLLLQTFIRPGDKVLVQTPVYYPFYRAIDNIGGEICRSSLLYQDGRYQMDFADLEDKVSDSRVTATILCSPHNPIGRVWTRDELTRFGEMCLKNHVLVISDEIHADLIMKGHIFTPFAAIHDDFARASITCTGVSKTFNLAG
jgi:cysteine-S-conjugate beta-lyase